MLRDLVLKLHIKPNFKKFMRKFETESFGKFRIYEIKCNDWLWKVLTKAEIGSYDYSMNLTISNWIYYKVSFIVETNA